ncbi:hypothetical protein [Plantactinospora sp. WMMB782]|uniref:hypothetical protein n=1 Tax=Plantactinospora sp. WMMB782 TaxID=3404121 RepID=UPI003B957413
MEPDWMTLATAGATALVTAVATDAWDGVKTGFARLFGRGDAERTAVAQRRLERVENELVGRSGAELEAARDEIASQWRGRLADLLEDHPEAAGELQKLVTAAALASPAAESSIVVGGDAVVVADRGSAAAMTMGNVDFGGVHLDPSRPGQPSS